MPTEPEHLAAWVALAKLGAVSIGINPSYTSTELSYTQLDNEANRIVNPINSKNGATVEPICFKCSRFPAQCGSSRVLRFACAWGAQSEGSGPFSAAAMAASRRPPRTLQRFEQVSLPAQKAWLWSAL